MKCGDLLSMKLQLLHTWKKDVWDGSMPVGPAGTVTLHCAIAPTRAGAGTLYLPMMSRQSVSSPAPDNTTHKPHFLASKSCS